MQSFRFTLCNCEFRISIHKKILDIHIYNADCDWRLTIVAPLEFNNQTMKIKVGTRQVYEILRQYIHGVLPDMHAVTFPQVYNKFEPIDISISIGIPIVQSRISKIIRVHPIATSELELCKYRIDTLEKKLAEISTIVQSMPKIDMQM